MTQNSVTTRQGHSALLAKRMLIGAAIALVLIAVFVLPVQGRPEWDTYWKVRPLLVVPFAGAIGGVFYHLMDYFRYKGGWVTVVVNVLSVIVYIFGLWMGTVLGLVGTLWN